MYTFYYSYHNQLMEIGDDNTADKVAITSLLKLPGIESSLEESISLAEKFFSSKFDEMRRLIYVWLMNENVGETQFQGVICDRDFHYQNKTLSMDSLLDSTCSYQSHHNLMRLVYFYIYLYDRYLTPVPLFFDKYDIQHKLLLMELVFF